MSPTLQIGVSGGIPTTNWFSSGGITTKIGFAELGPATLNWFAALVTSYDYLGRDKD